MDTVWTRNAFAEVGSLLKTYAESVAFVAEAGFAFSGHERARRYPPRVPKQVAIWSGLFGCFKLPAPAVRV